MAAHHFWTKAFVLFMCLYLTQTSFNINSILACFKREYNFRATKNYTTVEGRVFVCSDIVTVYSCYGRCISSEIADYKLPYKISDHKVCTYGGIRRRIVELKECDIGHPDPFYEVFDATSCSCRSCSSETTSCENLNG